MEFAGFPAGAFSFYGQLRVDNSKAFWIAHKGEYEQYVLRLIIALGEELEKEFGVASVFRPYRDIRFSADKSPYKTYQGMFVERAAEGDQMKTRPRGIPADHPRVELLRYRSLTGSRTWPPGPQLYSRDAAGLVRDTWRQLVPLCNWLAEHVGGPQP